MGWGRTLLLGNVGNRLDIEDVETNIDRLRTQVNSRYDARRRREASRDEAIEAANERIADLESEVQDMMLYITGLADLLVAHADVPREKLQGLVNAVERGSHQAE